MLHAQSLQADLITIRAEAPLVHNITNFVVMQQTANALLALGASPVMAHAEEEIEDMARIAKAVVINMGTLDSVWVLRMQLGLEAAKRYALPCVFDPVGAGATPYRTLVAQRLMQMEVPLVIRGNAAEILALANQCQNTKGVDSSFDAECAMEAGKYLSQQYGHVIVISGKTDIILQGSRRALVHNGVPLMTKVTGMGCTATAFIGAFCAVNPDPFVASLHAMTTLGIAGEIAFEQARGPGSFKPALLDVLYYLNEANLSERTKYEVL